MTAVVRAEQDSRLDRLAAEYAQLKPAVDAQTKRLKEVTEAIKVELVNTAPGETHVVLHADVLDNPLQLLRISLPAAAGLYPEISGSHYRCNVRFLTWKGLATRSAQTEVDVPFILSCCT